VAAAICPGRIAGDTADRVFAALRFGGLLPCRNELIRLAQLGAALAGETPRALACEQGREIPQHQPRDRHRMANALNRRHPAEVEIFAVHDRSVHLDLPVGVEDGAEAGIEGGIVLEDPDGGFDGFERRSAPFQDRLPGRQRGQAACPVCLLLMRRNVLRPAMEDQRPGHS
jgi:hypothetical protein